MKCYCDYCLYKLDKETIATIFTSEANGHRLMLCEEHKNERGVMTEDEESPENEC